jgi:signal transduction histidine kinase/CheY-like chemotaxis protein
MMVTNLLTAPILVALMWDIISHKVLLTWLAVILIACALTSISYLYLKPFFKDLSSVPQKYFYYQLPLVFGIIWGAAGYYFFSFDSMVHLSSLFIFLFAIASSALIILSSLWLAYILFIVPTILPFIILFFIRGDSEHSLLAMLIIIFVGVMIFLSRLTYGFITRLIEMRYENAALLIAVEKQKNEAIEANKDKSRFLSAASHDLRQPVHSLSLLTSAITPEISSTKGKNILTQIETANDVMLDLLNSLLGISKLDADIVEAKMEVVNVQQLINKVVGEFALLAKENGLDLRSHTKQYFIKSDPILLENILRNLLQNAIRYTKEGAILVSCRKRKGDVLIQVWDTGKGIAPKHQELIFVEFQQLQNPERDQNKGLGLGLAICRRLAVLIGAKLSLKSLMGKGSVFALKIPMMSDDAVLKHQALKVKATPVAKIMNLEQAVVLVIDDNETVLNAMSTLLEGWGCEILTASSIAETIEIATSYKGQINAIVADYRLRENTTGVEAMTAFSEQVDYQFAKVIITGDTAPDRMQEIVAHGIPVLHKPIKSAHLKTALGSMLRQNR